MTAGFEKLLFCSKNAQPALAPKYSHFNTAKIAQIRWENVKVPSPFRERAVLALLEGQNRTGQSFSHGISLEAAILFGKPSDNSSEVILSRGELREKGIYTGKANDVENLFFLTTFQHFSFIHPSTCWELLSSPRSKKKNLRVRERETKRFQSGKNPGNLRTNWEDFPILLLLLFYCGKIHVA